MGIMNIFKFSNTIKIILSVFMLQSCNSQLPTRELVTPSPINGVIQKIAKENGIDFQPFDQDEVMLLTKGDKTKYIKKYVLPINSSSSALVCQDKAATSALLKESNIPQIEHTLFLNPTLVEWVPPTGSWKAIHKYGKSYKYQLVCKPTEGSGGKNIFHVKDARGLEKAASTIFKSNRSLVLCPYKKFKSEYRVLIYNQEVELILQKNLPVVIGDGKRTKGQLLQTYIDQLEEVERRQKLLKAIKKTQPDLLFSEKIPTVGEEVSLDWLYNGPGSVTQIKGGKIFHAIRGSKNEDEADPTLRELINLALRTTETLCIKFAAVDIAEIEESNEEEKTSFCVLEVNSAPMLDHKMDTNPDVSKAAEHRIYSQIIQDFLTSAKSKVEKSLASTDVEISEEEVSEQEKKFLSLAKLLQHIAKRHNKWDIVTYNQGWISRFSNSLEACLVYGYTFPLNSSVTSSICKSKGLTSLLLEKAGIPHIKHHKFNLLNNKSSLLIWPSIEKVAAEYNFNVICKPNSGTGGANVIHTRTVKELESAIYKNFRPSTEIALCKFENIKHEYRLIMLEGEPQIIFRKEPPYVIGDGITDLQTLADRYLAEVGRENLKRKEKILKNMDVTLLIPNRIPEAGEKVFLHWQHNLGRGAACELIGGVAYKKLFHSQKNEEDAKLIKDLVEIAQRTVKLLDARFVSVDIAEIEDASDEDQRLLVMEVNSGVMMDSLMELYGEKGKEIATNIYEKAINIALSESLTNKE